MKPSNLLLLYFEAYLNIMEKMNSHKPSKAQQYYIRRENFTSNTADSFSIQHTYYRNSLEDYVKMIFFYYIRTYY